MIAEHIRVYERTIHDLRDGMFDQTWNPINPQKCVAILEQLSGSTDKHARVKLLNKFRDAFNMIVTVKEFSSIKTYEAWVNSLQLKEPHNV
jgi:hypothetical protein